jgi:hypothetical protein
VVTASYLNRVRSFKAPTGKTVTLAYDFNVVGMYLVAPAFVNTTALPHMADRAVPVANASLLMLQGSLDHDTRIMGLPHYDAARPPPGHFKAVVTLHGGNHNQFNKLWAPGMDGLSMRLSSKDWLFNRADLLPWRQQYDATVFFGSVFALTALYPDGPYASQYRQMVQSPAAALIYRQAHSWLTTTEVRGEPPPACQSPPPLRAALLVSSFRNAC